MFPTAAVAGWHTLSVGAADRNGNPAKAWTPALDAVGTAVDVYGIAPTQTTEPQQDHAEDLWDLLVPSSVASQPGDVVDFPELGQFEVVGELQDYSKGPFGYTPGGVVQLRRYR